jgi:hypothetical protein
MVKLAADKGVDIAPGESEGADKGGSSWPSEAGQAKYAQHPGFAGLAHHPETYCCHLLYLCLPAGIYHKVPFTQQEWNEWALTPADDGTLHYMHELGKADAAAWAKHSGHAAQAQPGASQKGGSRKLTAGNAAH